MYNYFLLHGRKHFYRYCLQAFSTKKKKKKKWNENAILKIVLKLTANQGLLYLKKAKTLNSEFFKEK